MSKVINIMLRNVNYRIWECQATCTKHKKQSIFTGMDKPYEILNKAVANLECERNL